MCQTLQGRCRQPGQLEGAGPRMCPVASGPWQHTNGRRHAKCQSIRMLKLYVTSRQHLTGGGKEFLDGWLGAFQALAIRLPAGSLCHPLCTLHSAHSKGAPNLQHLELARCTAQAGSPYRLNSAYTVTPLKGGAQNVCFTVLSMATCPKSSPCCNVSGRARETNHITHGQAAATQQARMHTCLLRALCTVQLSEAPSPW